MMETSTFERLRQIITDHLGVDASKVTIDTSFAGDLGADSLDEVELVMAIEEEFDIVVSDDDAEHILIVGDAVKYIDRRREP